MFNINDKIAFHIIIYIDDNKQITPVYSLPRGINDDFKLPENTTCVELKEFKEELGIPSLTTIRHFYIESGKEMTLEEVCNKISGTNLKATFASSLSNIDLQTKDKVIIEETDEGIFIKRKIEPKDLIFKNVSDLEKYIKRLTIAIDSFKQKTEELKRILKPE